MELREKIEGILIALRYGDLDMPIEYETTEGATNAILDAVLTTLPADRLTDSDLNLRNHGYDEAISEVRAILEQAKEQTK